MSDNSFVELLDKYRNEFYRYVYRNVWNDSAAEDVFSSAVLAAYRQLDKFQEGTNFRAWMYRILTNKCYVANRETQRSSIDIDTVDESRFARKSEDMVPRVSDPAEFLSRCGDEVHAALRQLNTSQRSCLLLLTIGRYSYKEIAQILDMPVGTVMTNLARGRARLRRLLGEYARQEGIIEPVDGADSKLSNTA
jgi:RNA polymerase sigma-70 factor (ECF subfamily)